MSDYCDESIIKYTVSEGTEQLEFEDRASKLADYPRLVSKAPIVKPVSATIERQNNTLSMEVTFDQKTYKRTRVFNSSQFLKIYLKTKFEDPDPGTIERTGKIDFEIGYHWGQEKLYLTIIRTFLSNIFCLGGTSLFDTLGQIEEYMLKRYERTLSIPIQARAKLTKTETERES